MNKVVTRIAPSPTGHLHMGLARTALFNYVFAKQNNGDFLIRIEDTDEKRSTKESEKEILDGLEWLGLTPDSQIIRQSERGEIYKKYLKKLLDSGFAYVSEEKTGESKTVIRFKNPNKIVSFTDLVRGDIEIETTDLGDFVIAKDLDNPLYHLVVVIDDIEMGITHVIRGEDHISNTPRQILIQEALGSKKPIYAHLPLILSADRSKLGKRHGAQSINSYKEKGYQPDAIINFLSLMGWHPEGDEEIFSMRQLINNFKLENIHKSGAIFDESKLNFLNNHSLRNLNNINMIIEENIPDDSLLKNSKNTNARNSLILDKINYLSEIKLLHQSGNEFDFFIKLDDYDVNLLIDKKTNPDLSEVKEYLNKIISKVENLDDFPEIDAVKNSIWDYATEKGRGRVLWPMRVALSGKAKSPDPFTIVSLLGRNESLIRLNKAYDTI